MKLQFAALILLIPALPAIAQAPTSAATDISAGAAGKLAGLFDPPPPAKGQIIFYRPPGSGPLGCMVREGEGPAEVHLSKLTGKKYFAHYADPGVHRYWAKNLSKDGITLEVEAGETYFVKCEIAIGMMSSNPNLSPSTLADFEAVKDKLEPMPIQGK
jgi:hypothetical protein